MFVMFWALTQWIFASAAADRESKNGSCMKASLAIDQAIIEKFWTWHSEILALDAEAIE